MLEFIIVIIIINIFIIFSFFLFVLFSLPLSAQFNYKQYINMSGKYFIHLTVLIVSYIYFTKTLGKNPAKVNAMGRYQFLLYYTVNDKLQSNPDSFVYISI